MGATRVADQNTDATARTEMSVSLFHRRTTHAQAIFSDPSAVGCAHAMSAEVNSPKKRAMPSWPIGSRVSIEWSIRRGKIAWFDGIVVRGVPTGDGKFVVSFDDGDERAFDLARYEASGALVWQSDSSRSPSSSSSETAQIEEETEPHCQSSSKEALYQAPTDTKASDIDKLISDIKCSECGDPSETKQNQILLCDGIGDEECSNACHQYCCQPPLAKIPKGKWFCPECVEAMARGEWRGGDHGQRHESRIGACFQVDLSKLPEPRGRSERRNKGKHPRRDPY